MSEAVPVALGADERREWSLGMLALTLVPGLGPVLIDRLLRAFEGQSPWVIFQQTSARLETIKGLGGGRARAIGEFAAKAREAARVEMQSAMDLGATIVTLADEEYPGLLREIPSAPPVLYVRGKIEPEGGDKFPMAIVGSRKCTHYGMEQTERFASALASAGLTIVSGGARGIDTAAHRAALRVGGRTIAVLGCGLAHCYPEENAALFESIAQGRGAVISELPIKTGPSAENFPARNRIISGLSLGVLVIEAGLRSGSLITARQAVEEHGREVFALPGRVDSPACEGSLELIKSGGAALVTSPGDIIEHVQQAARHQFMGTHAVRYGRGEVGLFGSEDGAGEADREHERERERETERDRETERECERETERNSAGLGDQRARSAAGGGLALSESQSALLAALRSEGALAMDDLVRVTGASPGALRADLTILELRRAVAREGSRFVVRG